MTKIKDKVAIVTGAASGMGRDLAVQLAERGAKAVVICDVNEAELAKTEEMVKRLQVPVLSRKVDVADRTAVETLAEDTISQFGGVDLMFNNAGVATGSTAQDAKYEDIEWLMGINFWGVIYGTKAVLNHMLEKGEGHIINTSSIFGFIGVPSQTAYCAAKFGVRGYTESLIHELEGLDVHATTVHPGGIKTNIAANARMDPTTGVDKADAAANFEKLARTTSADAAKVILNGVEKNKKRVMIGGDAHVITRMVRYFPRTYYWILGRMGKRARAELKNAG
ncbi:MAG: SDR family NAD(P)-dependent oxidoreductase [Alphaproteobacteria bacterium]